MGWSERLTKCKSFGISGYKLLLPYGKIQLSIITRNPSPKHLLNRIKIYSQTGKVILKWATSCNVGVAEGWAAERSGSAASMGWFMGVQLEM